MTINRALSTALKRQLFKPFRDQDIRVLLTISHPTWGRPVYLASGDPFEADSLTSGGIAFQTFPFEVGILTDEDAQPQATIRIQNADDRLGALLLALPDTAVSVTLQVVMRATPDTIEYEADGLELVNIQINDMEIQGQLVIRGLAVEPCPGRVLSNAISPVMFR